MSKKSNKSIGKQTGSPSVQRKPSAYPPQVRALLQETLEQLNRQDIRGAAASVERGLKLAPDHPDLLHLGGQIAAHVGNLERAREMIAAACKRAPKIGLYQYNLGNVLVMLKDLDGAVECFRKAVRLDPKLVDAYANLGVAFVKKQRHEEAYAAFVEAARLAPDNLQAQLNLAIACMEVRKPAETAAAIARVEALMDEGDVQLLHRIGNIYRGLGRHTRAEEYYQRALELAPDQAAIWFALGDVRAQAGEYDKAMEALEVAERQGFETGPLKLAMGRVASGRGQIALAKELFAEAEQHTVDSVTYLHRIAHQYTLIGDFVGQERCLNRVLELDPDNVGAFAGLAFAPGRKLSDREATHLREMAEVKSVDADTRRNISFALGDYYRYAKRYDDSFRFYRLGNKLKGYSFDRQDHIAWLNWVESTLTADFFAQRKGWGSDSRLPVLIVGMPRSGTTLTEQIISSHPAVYGAGEYGSIAQLSAVADQPVPDFRRNRAIAKSLTEEQARVHADAYLQRMHELVSQGESFVTNKLPHNFLQLGLFGLLFPEAPVIHIKRDPRDNLLSIYFQDFAGFHDYAYDLKTLGIYYRLYERLMAHWEKVVPNPIYNLQYEDLVADLPTKARELADFVGLEWDDRMLRFYEQERMVQTASKWQVRQKLYTTSVSRWKPYEKYLKPLFEALGPDV